MKIGVCASRFDQRYSRWGDKCYDKIKEAGFSCVDFSIPNTDIELYNCSDERFLEIITHEKKLIGKAGLTVSQVHGPWRYPPRDLLPEDREERLGKMKRSIFAAYLLNCKYWVIHPIMPYGTDDILTHNENKTWDMNLVFMKELLEYAKQYDVTICFENMPMRNFSIAKPEDTLRFVKEINDDNFKICLDTGHVAVFDELSLADETRRLGDYIKVLHVHDNLYNIDMHMMPYLGKIDWNGFISALKDIGYKGVFSLETVPSAKLPSPYFENIFKIMADMTKEMVIDI